MKRKTKIVIAGIFVTLLMPHTWILIILLSRNCNIPIRNILLGWIWGKTGRTN